jgi:hypothetical protein
MRGGIGVARGCFGVKNPLERKFFFSYSSSAGEFNSYVM